MRSVEPVRALVEGFFRAQILPRASIDIERPLHRAESNRFDAHDSWKYFAKERTKHKIIQINQR
jgi:hypothetical protein